MEDTTSDQGLQNEIDGHPVSPDTMHAGGLDVTLLGQLARSACRPQMTQLCHAIHFPAVLATLWLLVT